MKTTVNTMTNHETQVNANNQPTNRQTQSKDKQGQTRDIIEEHKKRSKYMFEKGQALTSKETN